LAWNSRCFSSLIPSFQLFASPEYWNRTERSRRRNGHARSRKAVLLTRHCGREPRRSFRASPDGPESKLLLEKDRERLTDWLTGWPTDWMTESINHGSSFYLSI
jgi:hypothetical protein